MDCIDCHNTVGASDLRRRAEQAVDRAIAADRMSRQLPFVRREAVALLKASYPSADAAAAQHRPGLRTLYAAPERRRRSAGAHAQR